MVITETKLDESFSAANFEIDGFHSPYVFNRSLNGGGIMVFVRDDFFSKELHMHKSCFSADIEGIFIEINLRKTKWLLFATYHPPSQNIEHFLRNISLGLDKYSPNYEQIILVGDFNIEEHIAKMSDFNAIFFKKFGQFT